MENDIFRVAKWLATAKRAVVLTGAGISTESGIPDFRSPGGVWTKYRTVMFDEFLESAEARVEYWRQKSEAHHQFAAAEPNISHRTLAAWENSGRIRGVITQNIDGLHQLAGNQNILELHGTARQVQCLDCEVRMDVEAPLAQFRASGKVPPCPSCGGDRLKHATVSFGQMLPADVIQKAYHWSRDADVMLVIGTSLAVRPAADLPVTAARYGSKVVIINRDATELDEIATINLRGTCGEMLDGINQQLAHP